MATVVGSAALPSVRLGLAAMLGEHGHTVVPEDRAGEEAVWLLDAPDAAALERLGARGGELPRAAVVLADDPGVAPQLGRLGLAGWACLGRDTGGPELDLAVRAAEAGLVLMDLPTVGGALVPPPAGSPRREGIEALTPRELQVLQLIAEGLPNKGIARRWGSARTPPSSTWRRCAPGWAPPAARRRSPSGAARAHPTVAAQLWPYPAALVSRQQDFSAAVGKRVWRGAERPRGGHIGLGRLQRGRRAGEGSMPGPRGPARGAPCRNA